jgi:hypothetical protein
MSDLAKLRRFWFVFLLLVPFTLLLLSPADAREWGTFGFKVGSNLVGTGEQRISIKKNNTTLQVTRPPMDLDINFFKAMNFKNGSGSDCFPGGAGLDPGHYAGAFVVYQNQDGSAHADFFFIASGVDGREIKYWLQMFGEFDEPNNVPPAVDTTVSAELFYWQMVTEGRGKDRKFSCTGQGSFVDLFVDIERIQ